MVKVKIYECEYQGCNYTSNKKWNLKRHKVNIHNENIKWKICSICKRKFKQYDDLKRHKRRMHNDKKEEDEKIELSYDSDEEYIKVNTLVGIFLFSKK